MQSRDLEEEIQGTVRQRFGFHIRCIPKMTVKEMDQFLLSYL